MKNALCLLTYNSKREIADLWPALLLHKHPLHIVIVDNASTDGTAEMFQRSNIPFTRNTTNNYYSAGMNQCIRKALESDPEWVFIVNPDTVLTEDWDERIVAHFTQQKNVGIVGCRLTTPDGKLVHAGGEVGKPKAVYWPTSYQLGDSEWEVVQPDVVTVSRFHHSLKDSPEPRATTWVTFAVTALRADMLRQIGLLDEEYLLYCSDANLCVRAWASGWEVWYNPLASFQHKVSANVRAAGSEIHEICKADLRRGALEETKWQLSLGDRRVWRM